MKKLIILEYFTSQSSIDLKKNRSIFQEALNISNSIIKNFIKSNKIKKIIVIRNENLEILKSKKVSYYFTNIRVSYIEILKKLKPEKEIILIAPETDKISLKILKNLNDFSEIIGSSLECIESFSSKNKTLNILKKFRIPVVDKIKAKKLLSNSRLIAKPEYGAGSDKVYFIDKISFIKDKNYILQKYHAGKKGSFLMLCKNGKNKVICCNEQITKVEENRISQIGCIMGGLECFRKEIEILANQITKKFKGLLGIVGVDIVRHKNKWLVLEINSRFTSSYCGIENSYDFKTLDAITNFYLYRELDNINPKLLKKLRYIF